MALAWTKLNIKELNLIGANSVIRRTKSILVAGESNNNLLKNAGNVLLFFKYIRVETKTMPTKVPLI